MRREVLIDAGPLVAFVDQGEFHHAWAKEQFHQIAPPQLTSEAVVSEACFLLQRNGKSIDAVLSLLRRKVISVVFHLDEEFSAIDRLLVRYADVPMSVADACLVRMAELRPKSAVFTLDEHFKIYRRNGRQVIPTIMPD